MKTWALKHGDPLSLILSADARMTETDYADDQIWELKLGQGETTALFLQTTYGMRARDMRLFLALAVDEREVVFARDYYTPPRVLRIYPNLIEISAQPDEKMRLQVIFFALNSHTILARMTLANPSTRTRQVQMGVSGILTPFNGHPLRTEKNQNVHVLIGQSQDLHPLVFMTGGAEPSDGPYAGLHLNVELGPGASRTLTWVHTALDNADEAFRQARRAAAQPLDALMARADLLNASDTVSIETGDPDWDAMLYLSQSAALGKLFSGGKLAHLTFVASRRPEQGFAHLPDGGDHHPDWQGQTAWDAWYLMQVLPGAPRLVRQIFMNFLTARREQGRVPARLGAGGQRLDVLATPILAQMAWQIYQDLPDDDFLRSVYPFVRDFFWDWFSPQQDRDRNGLPEWTHPLQSGYEENPLFSLDENGQGVAIETVQSPALAALLYGEIQALRFMARRLAESADIRLLDAQQKVLLSALETCWHSDENLYVYCDRDTHLCLPGKTFSARRARKRFSLSQKWKQPQRLQVVLDKARADGLRPVVQIHGACCGKAVEETLPEEAFRWQGTRVIATTQRVYDNVGEFFFQGVQSADRLKIRSVDLTQHDLTLFAPLCTAAASLQQTRRMLDMRLLDTWHFLRPYGLSMQPDSDSVALPWNALLIQGLLSYGLQEQAAQILVRLGQATVRSLQSGQAFYAWYDGNAGTGQAGRHALRGSFPVGLFLRVLGVELLGAQRVRISGENPFPWPITVRYRTLVIERGLQETQVRWLGAQAVTIPHPQTRILDFS